MTATSERSDVEAERDSRSGSERLRPKRPAELVHITLDHRDDA
jgi:hypothetical protein